MTSTSIHSLIHGALSQWLAEPVVIAVAVCMFSGNFEYNNPFLLYLSIYFHSGYMVWKINMPSFKVVGYISYILNKQRNTSSGMWSTLVKTTLLPGHNGVTVVVSLPTIPSHDVTANIPIVYYSLLYHVKSRKYQGVFEVKSRVKTWQVRGIWSQQLEH